jgi:Tfp pilus assembly protein PilF
VAKKRRKGEEPDGGPSMLDRVFELLAAAPAGLHDVEPPAAELPAGLPEPLIELYARCDGARLFLDSAEIAPSAEVARAGDARWTFATVDGDDVAIDARGWVWRADDSLGDDVCEGTRLDRWLAGTVEAIAMLYDDDGEFADGVFDEDGELVPAVSERALRAQVRRDPAAPGPRWRLAHALLAQDGVTQGRAELEEVVAHAPEFAWAWLDLARISERLGELPGAVDEARAAAEAALHHPQAGYFHAQLARLASRAGDEATRAAAARRAAELDPQLKAAQLAGARDSLAAGDLASARGLVELLRAVWPRDLEVLALAGQLLATAAPDN